MADIAQLLDEMDAQTRSVMCGYTVVDADGIEDACNRPATSWRWYQDVEHEDCLARACDEHANEGGIRMAALACEVRRLTAAQDEMEDRVDLATAALTEHTSLPQAVRDVVRRAERAEAERDAYRKANDDLAQRWQSELAAVRGALAAVWAALQEVAALHRSVYYDGVEWCAECISANDDGMVPWPCPTVRIFAHHSGGESDGPVRHIGGEANAEDCPACRTGDGGPLPYPFICPGEPAGADRSEASDG